MLLLATSVTAADVFIDDLDEKPINRTLTSDGIRLVTDYANVTIPYKNASYPDRLHKDLSKWSMSTTEKSDSFELDFQSEWGSSAPDALAGLKVNEKLKVDKGETKSTLYSGGFADDSGKFVVNVTAESHYEHIVLTYQIINSSGNVTSTYEDVYSDDDDPDRIAVADGTVSNLHWRDEPTSRYQLVYDNLYDDGKEVTVAVITTDEASVEGVSGGESVENVSFSYQEVKDRALNQGLGVQPPNLSEGYTVDFYNVTVPADSTAEITATIDRGHDGEQAYMFLLGSVAGSETALEGQPVVSPFDWNRVKNISVKDDPGIGHVTKAQ